MNVKIIFVLLIISIIFVSGCVQQSVCGNGITESGEECDGTGCTGDEICTENCVCENLAPPILPE